MKVRGGIYVSTFRDLGIKRCQIAQNDRNDLLYNSVQRINEKGSATSSTLSKIFIEISEGVFRNQLLEIG